VAKPDDTFSWELRTHFRAKGADAIELLLQSQTWQGVAWKHQVVLIKPRGLDKPNHALLIVGGGRWQESYAEPSPGGEEDLPKGVTRSSRSRGCSTRSSSSSARCRISRCST